MPTNFIKDRQYWKFCAYGFLKNLRFYDAFLLLYFLENGLSFTQIGVLYAVREITINVAEVPSGLVADTYGRKYSLVAAFGIYLVAFLIYYVSYDFFLLLLATFLIGVGDAFRSGTHKGMIMDYLREKGWEKQKVAYYGQTRSWSQMGSAISAFFAGLMILYSGSYRSVYVLAIVPYLLNFVNIYTYPSSLNFAAKRQVAGASVLSNATNFFRTIRKKEVFTIVNSAALHSAFLKTIKDYVQLLMVNIALLIPLWRGLETTKKNGLVVGLLYSLIFLLNSWASRSAIRLSESGLRNIPNKSLLTGLGCGMFCGLLMHFEYWLWALLLFVTIYIIESLRKPILTGLLADEVENRILTSVLSAQSSYQTLVAAMAAPIVGLLADRFGVGIALAVISIALIFLTLLTRQRLI